MGIFYYIMTLNNTRKNQEMQLETRQAQLFMQVYNRFNSRAFVSQLNEIRFRWSYTDLDDFMEKYGPKTNPEANDSMGSTIYFFEGIGVLMKKGLIDTEFVDDLMSGVIVSLWDKFGPMIIEQRERYNWPTAAEWFEYLYNQIKPLYDEQHPEYVGKRIAEELVG